jgi:Spy/CpxP family protein refolding chaperone
MKLWIKRSLAGLTTVAVILGGLAACGSHGEHAKGWSNERIAEVRGKAMDKIGSKLELNADQKQKLGVLADEMMASSKAFRGEGADPRADLKALVAGDKFDRTKAQALMDQKMQVMQGNGPKILKAFGDFYDSLNAVQQKQVRERLEKRSHAWWNRG